MSDLKVTIGADSSELTTGLKKAGKEVEGFSDKTDKGLKGVGEGLKNVAKSSNSAGQAMTNFGRVLQDAPFGFIGIQNNLNPLLEGFQRLKAESGSTGGAIKALAGSFMGAGGIGLALSLVTAGFTFAQMGLRAWGIDLDKGKEKVDKLTDSVKSLAEMQKEANKNAASEVGELRALYNATQDLATPLSTRIRLVKELKSQFPDYFSQFSQEAILAGKAAANYDKLTTAIKAKGLAQAGEKNRGIIINKIFDEEDKKIQAQIALTAANEQKLKLQTQFYETLDNQARTALKPKLDDIKKSVVSYRTAITSADNEIATLNKSLSITDALTQKLVKQFGGGILTGDVGGFATGQDKKDKPKVEKKKTPADILKQLGLDLETIRVTGQASGESFAEGFDKAVAANKKAIGALIGIGVKTDSPIIGQLTDDIKKLTPLADGLQAKFADLSANVAASVGQLNTTNLIPFDKGLADIAARMPKYTSYMKETLDRFNEDVTNIINGGLMDTFAGIGSAIGEAFASGTSLAEGLGQALLGTLAEVLGQLGKLAIATGVAMLGIKAAFKNPFGAIAAGVALVALSAFVAKKASSIGNSVGGGSSGVGSPASGSSSGSGFSSSNATGQGISGTVVFEISGYKLLGVLQNVTGRNLRIS